MDDALLSQIFQKYQESGQLPVSRLGDAIRSAGMNPTASEVSQMLPATEAGLTLERFQQLMQEVFAKSSSGDQAQALRSSPEVSADRTGYVSQQKTLEIRQMGGHDFTMANSQEAKDDAISPEETAETDKAEAEGCRDILEAAKENKVGAIRHFIRSDVNSLQQTDEEGKTPLHWAARSGHDSVVQRLLEAKAAVDAQNKEGWTPLLLAAVKGHDSMVERLLEAKAAVDAKDEDGETPLHWAAREGRDSVAQRLLEAKAAVDAQNKYGETPLHFAAHGGHDSVVQRLLEAKAAVDAKNKKGETPLHWAAYKGSDSVVERLLEAKAAVDAKDEDGRTPYDAARLNGHQKTMGLLHPAEPRASSSTGPNQMVSSVLGMPPQTHLMLSGRFSTPEKCEYMKSLKRVLEGKGVPCYLVEAGPGDEFGFQTMEGLACAKAMLAVCCEEYGANTGAGYETYHEVRYAWDHKLPILPLRLCEVYPPQPDRAGAIQNGFVFHKSLVRIEGRGRSIQEVAVDITKWARKAGIEVTLSVYLLSGRTCRCIYSEERSIKELKEEAEKKLSVTIRHLIGSDNEPLTESKRLQEANILSGSAVTAIIAAENFHYYEVVFKAGDDLHGLRFDWEPPTLIDLPNCAAVDTELRACDELIEVNDVDVTKLKQGEIEPMFTARPLKLAFRRKCEATQEEPAQATQEPTEKDDDLEDPKEFIEFLISANIRLVRLEFLLELHEDGKALPRRQEAETMRTRNGDTALVELHEYKKLLVNDMTGQVSMPTAERTSASALTTVNFCAVSHMWEAMQHPDPWGFQLAQLAEKYSKRVGNGLTWVFLDYVSLFQFRRTPEEDRWFHKALDRMHILYSHEAVDVTFLADLTPEHLKSASEVLAFCEADSLVVLMSIATLRLNSTPYHLRGWCQAEKQWAFLRGLLLAGGVPLTPQAFRQFMAEMRFTYKDDSALMYKLQEKVFKMKTSTTTHLQLEKLDRMALEHLREALPCYTRNDDAIALLRSGASDIQMENCGLHDAAAIIAETLLDQTTRTLKQLNLRRNGISGIADLGPLLDVMQQRPDLIIEMTPQGHIISL